MCFWFFFFFSSRRRHTRLTCDWSSDVCSSDLFRLAVREARCMTCGGELRPVEKECVRERIPPRTWCWLDEYFVCARCNQLFWHGTHWRKIGVQLARLSEPRNTGATGCVEIQTT